MPTSSATPLAASRQELQLEQLREMLAQGPRSETNASPEWEKLEAKARSIALRRLTRCPQSRHQLEEAMAGHEIPPDVAAEVLDRLTAVGLIDDDAFAEMLVRTRHKERGLTGQALRQELRRYGVNSVVAQKAMSQLSRDDERLAAVRLAKKKLASTARLDRDTRVRRTMSFLMRRGCNPGLASTVIRELLAEE